MTAPMPRSRPAAETPPDLVISPAVYNAGRAIVSNPYRGGVWTLVLEPGQWRDADNPVPPDEVAVVEVSNVSVDPRKHLDGPPEWVEIVANRWDASRWDSMVGISAEHWAWFRSSNHPRGDRDVRVRLDALPEQARTMLLDELSRQVQWLRTNPSRRRMLWVDTTAKPPHLRRQLRRGLILWAWRLLKPRCADCRRAPGNGPNWHEPCEGYLSKWRIRGRTNPLVCWCVCQPDCAPSWAAMRGWRGGLR